jgi:hypothetical protein
MDAANGRPDWCCIGGRCLSAVEVAAAAPAVGRRSELPLQLHEAPDPGAVGAEVRLDVGGELADGGQVGAEQLGAPLQQRRDRPVQVLRTATGPTVGRHWGTAHRHPWVSTGYLQQADGLADWHVRRRAAGRESGRLALLLRIYWIYQLPVCDWPVTAWSPQALSIT